MCVWWRTDDEVGASVVLADHHVLEGLAGAGHVHRVGQVGPVDARVLRLLLQHLHHQKERGERGSGKAPTVRCARVLAMFVNSKNTPGG